MKKQSFLGTGPVIIIPGYLALIITAQIPYSIPLFQQGFLTIFLGGTLCSIGALFVVLGAYQIKKARESNTLATEGLYSLTRNPIYCGHIFFILPGVSIIINNGYSLVSTIISYILFKIFISKEENFLKETFGERFSEYCKKVNQIFPFPKL
ncbi:isoprenylcysteine carboxylmethyltransferase family protein [Desulfohalobiaceae bacterium Ax17]|uniref:methyltransferase family protein n=1 Tax=Desulfovulcanus ferrireducens TaxID=2831190 RepID=UPI00207BB5AE|nr:isoprenylcysteine carboxylmethyltransferase family protein [Desulfovulcanus ferrireducens]MBT8763254.1 isoprenylcysteine carboxylmethyltransferase family protein [Desulfovulcanus ferrireducens]